WCQFLNAHGRFRIADFELRICVPLRYPFFLILSNSFADRIEDDLLVGTSPIFANNFFINQNSTTASRQSAIPNPTTRLRRNRRRSRLASRSRTLSSTKACDLRSGHDV